MSPCSHEQFKARVSVANPRDGDEGFSATISIRCGLCEAPFEFAGVVEGPGITLSADQRELRVAIVEAREGVVQ